jgi:hypothetical protein
VSTTYQFFKDFMGPIETVFASLVAMGVTLKLELSQRSIAREQAQFAKANSRSTQQKLILDLFDKRFSIVTELREAIEGVMSAGAVRYDYDAHRKFHSAANRARWLFGPDVTTDLEKIDALLLRQKGTAPFRDTDDAETRDKAVDALFREFKVIHDLYTSLDSLIAPYMQMHDRVPS